MKYIYSILINKTDGVLQYGIRASLCRNGMWETNDVPNITNSAETIRSFLKLIRRYRVTPNTVQDVASDFLAE